MRQIDQMTPQELEMLHVKNMLATLSLVEKAMQPKIYRKRVELFKTRIDACDTLLDYLHDDVPWKDQQPLMDMLRSLRGNFEDQLFEGTHPDE